MKEDMSTQETYIGIYPQAGKDQTVFAVLDADLKSIKIGRGDIDAVRVIVEDFPQAVVGIQAPPRLSMGILTSPEKRAQYALPSRPGRPGEMRLAEYELNRRGLPTYRTPEDGSKVKGWMVVGFGVHRMLDEVGFQSFSEGEGGRRVLEVIGEVFFRIWLEGNLYDKDSFEGRIQRQLVLYEMGLDIADPMLFFEEITRHRILQGSLPKEILLEADELQALAAGYAAWASVQRPEEVSYVGDEEEGQVTVPVEVLKQTGKVGKNYAKKLL
jgi:hypothetical protein